eukprot:gene4658-14855_t
MLTGLSVFIAIVAVLFVALFHKKLFRRPVPGTITVPVPQPCHWLLGHLPLLIPLMKAGGHLDALIQDIMKEGTVGKVFMLHLGVSDFVIVQDADAVKEILSTKGIPKSPTYDTLHPFIGSKSMLVSEGARWHQQRSAFNPSFAYVFLKQLVPTFVDAGMKLLLSVFLFSVILFSVILFSVILFSAFLFSVILFSVFLFSASLYTYSMFSLCLLRVFSVSSVSLFSVAVIDKYTSTEEKEGPIVKLQPLMTGLTLDIICHVALAESFNSLEAAELEVLGSKAKVSGSPPASEMYYLFQELVEAASESSRGGGLKKFVPWHMYRLHKAQTRFDRVILKVVEERIRQIQENKANAPADILSMAVATAADEGGGLDLQDILSQVKTFLFAGHDTTATTMSFAIYEVSKNPEIERKVLEEIASVCSIRSPTSVELAQLTYMGCVVKETLRMWPPGGTARMAEVGETIQGYDIGGKIMYIAHLPIHRDPDYWGPDADVFRPERWQDEAYVAKLHPFCYMPFSKGPRDCIGQNFAQLEIKTLLSILLVRYRFVYTHDKPEAQGFRITTFPKPDTGLGTFILQQPQRKDQHPHFRGAWEEANRQPRQPPTATDKAIDKSSTRRRFSPWKRPRPRL